jgi:SAM-dependent methyltransferase
LNQYLREEYRHGRSVRAEFHNADDALAYYARYVAFVNKYAAPGSRILDAGCGEGWSTWALRRHGHDAVGMDLGQGARATGIPYVVADAVQLPFRDASFDAVAVNEVMEHIESPEAALKEFMRVLRRSGRLIVVGPHLLSVGMAAKYAFQQTWWAIRNRGKWERRTPDTPRHPYGNTLPETWVCLAQCIRQNLEKAVSPQRVRFLMRQPDTRPPFVADNDACYLLDPADLVHWARIEPGIRALQWWAEDRRGSRFFWRFTGGTWVVMEKFY